MKTFTMKKTLFFLTLTLSYINLFGQCDQGDCEHIPVNEQDINWSDSHGSPDWNDNNSVYLWSYKGNQGIPNKIKGEGVNYSGYNFIEGENYCITVTLKPDTNNGLAKSEDYKMNIILTQDAINTNTSENINYFIPSMPENSQGVFEENIWSNLGTEVEYTFEFHAEGNFNNIWFFPVNPNKPNPQIEVTISNLTICHIPCDLNISPAFEIEYSECNEEGVSTYDITVTANDENSPNHLWQLRETTQQGETQGGENVGYVQDGDTATWSNLDPYKFYYIAHAVWNDCVPLTVEVLALDPPHCCIDVFISHPCLTNTNAISSKKDKLITSEGESLVQKTCDPCIQGYADVSLVDSDGNHINASMYDSILWSNGDTTAGSTAYPGEPISVTVTFNEQCDSTADFLFECDGTSLVKISPNSNDGRMNLKVKTSTDIQNITLKIRNIQGVLIKKAEKFKVKDGELNRDIDVSSQLKEGMYFFVFTIGEETITKQVVIK